MKVNEKMKSRKRQFVDKPNKARIRQERQNKRKRQSFNDMVGA